MFRREKSLEKQRPAITVMKSLKKSMQMEEHRKSCFRSQNVVPSLPKWDDGNLESFHPLPSLQTKSIAGSVIHPLVSHCLSSEIKGRREERRSQCNIPLELANSSKKDLGGARRVGERNRRQGFWLRKPTAGMFSGLAGIRACTCEGVPPPPKAPPPPLLTLSSTDAVVLRKFHGTQKLANSDRS